MTLYARLLVGLVEYSAMLAVLGLLVAPLRPLALLLVPCVLALALILRFARRSLAHRRYLASAALAFLRSPLLLLRELAFGCGQLLLALRFGRRLPRPGQLDQRVEYRLPFEGAWTVANGGPERGQSHSWSILNQRYAYDFNVTGADRLSYQGRGEKLEEFLAFGRPIVAPADGRVLRARDGVPDHAKPGTGWIDWRAGDPRGNHVLIQHDRGEYSLLAHLQRGSVSVRPGDAVRSGQRLGLCGNSGHTTQPHLHFHVQHRAGLNLAVGLPVEFSSFTVVEADRSVQVDRGYPVRGQVVLPTSDETR